MWPACRTTQRAMTRHPPSETLLPHVDRVEAEVRRLIQGEAGLFVIDPGWEGDAQSSAQHQREGESRGRRPERRTRPDGVGEMAEARAERRPASFLAPCAPGVIGL